MRENKKIGYFYSDADSLIVHTKFYSSNAKSNTLIAMDSDTACLEKSKKAIRKIKKDGKPKIISC